jgi:hypothetical protein
MSSLRDLADDVAASDALAIDAAIREANTSIRVDALPTKEARVGCVSIAKVRFGFV